MPKDKSGRPPLKQDSYFRDYYKRNKDKYRNYAKNRRNKKKLKPNFKPLPNRDSFHSSDLMQMSPDKLAVTIDKILKNEFILNL